jgi:hypothetical protein
LLPENTASMPPLVALQAGGSHEVHRIVEAIRRHGGRPEAIISRGITKAPYESTRLAKLWSQRGHTHHCIGKQGVITLSFNTSPNGKSCVVALSDFRRIALSMPETEETNGMGHPNFRTGRKSFAAIEESMAVIRLTREQQATFVATAPEVFAPDSSGWGRLGNTVIRLEAADEKTVQVAVATAWSNVAGVVNASEIVDVADVQIATEFVNVEVSDTAEVADVVTAADVNATVVKVGNAGEVDDEVSAVAFVDLAEVVEAGDAAEVVNATFVVNPAEVAEVSASDVPNGAEVVEIEDAGVSVEPHNHLLSAPRQVANARNHGGRSMALTLVAIVKRENMIDLKFGEALHDPQPFVLTVTPGYVAHETAKSLPISGSDLHAYILAHVAKLRATAENCKARGLTSEVLQ